MQKLFIFSAILTLGLIGCNTDRVHHVTSDQITIDGDRFIDQTGREIILNGINVVNKNKADGYLFEGGHDFYGQLPTWGFNSIRFIIIWDRLEPEPGVYDEQYLQEIDERIKWAASKGLFVVLDMHQDLFSVLYSDGAPEWATLHNDQPHVTGPVWSDSYMLSGAVQSSFDNFWANTAVSDGIGLQDHYANLWKHIAARYANNSTVIGYDIMNEPFPGSIAQLGMQKMLEAYAGLVYATTGKLMTEEELATTWGDEEKRLKALELLSEKDNYASVIDAMYEMNAEFESTQLMNFYQRVSNAIRSVDTQHALFLEHCYLSNTGVSSGIRRTTLPNGSPDPQVAYAPHGYDLVTDTKAAAGSKSARVELIYERIAQTGNELKMPVWLGEWGAYYDFGDEMNPVAQHAIGLIEDNKFGNAYWSYNPGTENLSYFKNAILRPYPAAINGKLGSYKYDFDAKELEVVWTESNQITAPTSIFIPWMSLLDESTLGGVNYGIEKMADSDAGWLNIAPLKKGSERSLTVSFK